MDTISRFSGRVADYVRYRPSYPRELIPLLERDCGLNSSSVVADIGSGPGILTRLFLENGNTVFAVEPNTEMRAAAEHLMRDFDHFHSIGGTAETTMLSDRSVDLVVAGQAFHWFDAQRARNEFVRVLKPGGWVALVWNERRLDSTPFLRAYERTLRAWGIDYEQVGASYPEPWKVAPFFSPNGMKLASFENSQSFDLEGLRGRVLSASYSPRPGDPNHEPMLAELSRTFSEHQHDGRVLMDYDTRVYYGQLS